MVHAESRGRFLYEIRPDLFPYDHLCRDEMMLWECFYEDRKTRMESK